MSPVTRLQNRKALESLKALFDICPVCHEKLCPDKLFILHNHHAICINCKNSWLEQLNRHATTNTEGFVSVWLRVSEFDFVSVSDLVRACVCLYASLSGCAYNFVWLCVCVGLAACVCLAAPLCLSVSDCLCVCIWLCVSSWRRVCIWLCGSVWLRVCVCLASCVSGCMCLSVYDCVCVSI